eukprot:2858650-Prymnesium_polylepis.1
MQRVSRADSGQTARKAVRSGRECTAGGIAPLPAELHAELEDVAVGTSPGRRSRRWKASHRSSVWSGDRGANFYAQ